MYVLHRIEEVAPSDTAVLLEGETGVGKELIAQAVHKNSSRYNKPFIKVDCATIPPTLIESELFGHEKGAFSGAVKNRKGRFQLADGGTVFLDEIGEIPLEMQPKLLRVLQEGSFERLGSEKTTNVNVRVVAATNRDLKKEVEKGRFRGDLYFRLSVFPISIPPLRKRVEDIPLLTDTFVESFSKKHGKKITKISKYIREKLQSYDWPGNVRELQNVIERAVITTPGRSLKLQGSLINTVKTDNSNNRLDMTLLEIEKQHIVEILEHCSWKISGVDGAASLLGLHPNTLRSKMQKLGIKRATDSDPEINKVEI
jgi:transcriptional regulator with GAF, ATPase, and Fis domain